MSRQATNQRRGIVVSGTRDAAESSLASPFRSRTVLASKKTFPVCCDPLAGGWRPQSTPSREESPEAPSGATDRRVSSKEKNNRPVNFVPSTPKLTCLCLYLLYFILVATCKGIVIVGVVNVLRAVCLVLKISSPPSPQSHRHTPRKKPLCSLSSVPQHGSVVTQWLSEDPVALPLQAGAAQVPGWRAQIAGLPVHVHAVAVAVEAHRCSVGNMSERESVEVGLCSRPEPLHRNHKNNARSKDKHSSSGSYGRRGHVDAPPTHSYPVCHTRHHAAGPPRGKPRERERERRKAVRGRVDENSRGKLASLPAQLGGVGGEGRKKMSLNHLLNFTLSPRDARSRGGGEGQWRRRYKTHSYNKEQFLQANCQFVVADRGDYSVHTADPDLLVDWDSIELVRLFCHEIPSCPICLYPPRAAKITRCGHVYCWSCALHYLSLGEKKWRKCPICYESIYQKDLKSVMALSTPQCSVGDVITMRLMVRERDSTRVVPSSQWASTPPGLPSLTAPGERFVKLLTCSAAQSLELIVQPERAALTAQLSSLSPDEASEQCFVELALEELKGREVILKQMAAARREVDDLLKGGSTGAVETAPPEPRPPGSPWLSRADCYVEGGTVVAFSDPEEEEGKSVAREMESQSSGSASSSLSEEPHHPVELADQDSLHSSLEQLPASSFDSSPSRPADPALVYFYQAADGQHLYIHNVNARCLAKEYGGLEHAPNEIRGRIVEMEQLSMTEETRGRYKYLSHLPVTCEFVLCELDLRPPLISSNTLAVFQDDLEQRRHKRVKKRRDEKRREKKAVAATQKLPDSAAFPLPTSLYQPLSPETIHDLLPQLTSSPPLHSSTMTSPHLHPHTTPNRSSQLNPVAREFIPGQPSHSGGSGDGSTSLPMTGEPDGLSESPPAPSFAEALRGKPPPVWPIKQSPRLQAASTAAVQQREGDGEGGGEECAVPSFKEAFTDALLSAQVSTQQGQCSKKTAKKGRKKLVLFSTGGARGSHS